MYLFNIHELLFIFHMLQIHVIESIDHLDLVNLTFVSKMTQLGLSNIILRK